MFEKYADLYALDKENFTSWQFGNVPDELARLVLRGIKTATASAFKLHELDHEPLPRVGDYSVVLDSQDQAVCVIKTSKVRLVPFMDVSEDHAFKEGEGDRSLFTWRDIHQRVFTKWLQEYDVSFDKDMIVVCEEFELLYPK